MKQLYKKLYEAINTGIHSALVLDDDEDISIIYQHKKISNKLSSEHILPIMVEQFANVLNITINFDNPKNYCCTDIQINNDNHTIAAVYYYDSNNNSSYATHTWLFDYNNATNEYTIGPISTYANNFYGNIYKYFIDFISQMDADFYFGICNISYSYYTRTMYANDYIEQIKTSKKLNYGDISKSLSFFGSIKLNNIWYNKLPETNSFSKGIKNLDDKFKISHNFINNFKGIKNKGIREAPIVLYTCMFDTLEDFSKMTELFIMSDYIVIDEYNTEYTKDNYKKLLNIDNLKKINDTAKAAKEVENKKSIQIEEKSKKFIESHLDNETCSYFEQLNDGSLSPYKLSVLDLVMERKSSKDVYRKFNDDLLMLFLKDNNIDFDYMLRQSEDKAIKAANEIVKRFKSWLQKHSEDEIKNLHSLCFNTNYYKNPFDTFYKMYHDAKWFKSETQKIYKEYTQYAVYKIEYSDDLTDKDLAKLFLQTICRKSEYNYTLFHDCKYDFLLRRFICLLIKYCYEYDIYEAINGTDIEIDEKLIDTLHKTTFKRIKDTYLNAYILLSNNRIIYDNSFIETDSYNKYAYDHGTSLKECIFKLSNYSRLYAFYYCLAKALKNAYNIKVMNPFNEEFNVKTELNDNMEPDMQAVNFNVINNMFKNILKNKVQNIKNKKILD
ncbi:MAG: hypothetical protein [Wendovervirus sonii]|uniref:Uncharacterized protein n=1 Tax=phage Lak_Megaphage_Sonny TaxID=3109229 RepID=A0ABZ0Z5M6_9CAUD|nr:MAG: hypothetical protein [phage Lak_Megaphage_Sonny]